MRAIVPLCISIVMLCSCEQRVPENTPLTDLVLDRYSPRYRFGERFSSLRRGGNVTEIEGDAGRATMNVRFPKVGEFEGVRVLGQLSSSDSLDAAIATDFIFYASPSTSREAAQRVRADLSHVLGVRPRVGCNGSVGSVRDSMLIWEGSEGGGVALLIPESTSSQFAETHVTRLLIYPLGIHAAELVGKIEGSACDPT
jgi:hypothetical protein